MVSAPMTIAIESATQTAIDSHSAVGRSPGSSGCGASRGLPLCALAISLAPRERGRVELLAKHARGALGIVSAGDRAQDDSACRACGEHLVQVARIEAADGEERH